jgi:hypothetical protein
MKRFNGMFRLGLIFMIVISSITIHIPPARAAPTDLTYGDVAIIHLNMDNPDSLTFVALVDIPEGTEIRVLTAAGQKAANSSAMKAASNGPPLLEGSRLAPSSPAPHLLTPATGRQAMIRISASTVSISSHPAIRSSSIRTTQPPPILSMD